MRLANHDQDLVSRELCREFNLFLDRVRGYDRLQEPLTGLRRARGLTRGMMLGAALFLWLLISMVIGRYVGQGQLLMLLTGAFMLILMLLLIPASVYGTSVEAIEGRLLVVVQSLQAMLEDGEMGFSEAAYFVVRDVLREAGDELRQQVYLNRVARWRPR